MQIILNHVFHIQTSFINLWKNLFVSWNRKVAVYFMHFSQQCTVCFLLLSHGKTIYSADNGNFLPDEI